MNKGKVLKKSIGEYGFKKDPVLTEDRLQEAAIDIRRLKNGEESE